MATAVMKDVTDSTLPKPPIPDPANPDANPASPTTLVLNYLRSKGISPSGAAVRAALEANARDPSLIPGLRNDTPGTDPGVGQGGNVAGKVESGSKKQQTSGASRGGFTLGPAPVNADLGKNPYGDEYGTGVTSPTTSAAPDTGGPSGRDIAMMTLFGLGPAAGYGAYKLYQSMGRGGGAEFMGNTPPGPSGRVMDVNPPGIAAPDAAALTGPQAALPALEVSPGATTAATDPFEAAMQKAIPGPIAVPADVVGGQKLPPGVTGVDAANAAMAPGMDQRPDIRTLLEPPPAPAVTGPHPVVPSAPPSARPNVPGRLPPGFRPVGRPLRF